MTPIEATSNESPYEPEEAEVHYDLAGNPLPPSPKPDVPIPLPSVHLSSVHFAPAPPTPPFAFALPASYTPPPGAAPSSAPAPAAKAPSGPVLYIGLGVGLLLLVGLIFGIRALKPKLVTAPTSYLTYTAIDSSFSCDQPAGWTLHETGALNGNMGTATFESGHARVRLVSGAIGSLMADTMGAGNANLPPAMQVPVVEKLHKMDLKQLADGLEGYKEGDAQKLQSAVGDARVSEWTATGGVGTGTLHGYRVTMLGREREFTVICFCPERNWSLLMPAFQRIISSVKSGNPS